jgi:hypothetical protein
VQGINNDNVFFAIDVLKDPSLVKDAKSVAVIGGGFNALLNFQVQKVLAYKLIGFEYWEGKGWNDNENYFKCRINIFKRILYTSLGKFSNKLANK